jgi:hypothetical protein
MRTTISGPADELRQLRDTADHAAGEVVVITMTSGVSAAAVTSSEAVA